MILDRYNVYLSKLYQGLAEISSLPLVLEAGGGSFSHFVLPNNALPVSLDIDLDQLQRNQQIGLRICGDLHSLPVKQNTLDMVICFNVIEHLENPELALENMASALKPGGLLLIGCPNLASVKGIITKYTPIEFHRWYYRTIVKKKDRGGGHFDAFPTPFQPIVQSSRLQTWLASNNFEVVHFDAYDGAHEYNITTGSLLRKVVAAPYYLVCRLLRLITLGKFAAEHSDLLFIVRKG